MRLVTDEATLSDPLIEVEYLPFTATSVTAFVKTYKQQPVKSILDRIVAHVTTLRKNIRKCMKSESDPKKLAALDAGQLSAKVIQNSLYGFLGSTTSGMCTLQIVAAITLLGQFMIKTTRHMVLKEGGAVVYGDTGACIYIL